MYGSLMRPLQEVGVEDAVRGAALEAHLLWLPLPARPVMRSVRRGSPPGTRRRRGGTSGVALAGGHGQEILCGSLQIPDVAQYTSKVSELHRNTDACAAATL